MAKGYNSRGGFGGLNMNQLMKQAKKMQEDVTKSQEEISAKEFESTAGGGAISVVVSGDKKVKSITISKDVVDPDDVEMLEDLLVAAFNDAQNQVETEKNERMGKFGNLGGLGF